MKHFLVLIAFLIAFPSFAAETLQTMLERRISKAKAHVAVSVDVITPAGTAIAHYGVHEHDTMVSMSTIKLPLAVVALQAIAARRLSLDSIVHVDSAEAARDTYSPLRDRHPGPFSTTIREALVASVSLSDNIGTDVLIDALGGRARITASLRAGGLDCMELGTSYRDMTTTTISRNWTTAACMNRLMLSLVRGTLLDSAGTAWLYDLLLQTPTGPSRLKGKLPNGTPVAHKTGTMFHDDNVPFVEAINDVGIITLPSGNRVVISVLVNDAKMMPRAVEKLIAEIAHEVYAQSMRRNAPGR